MRRVRGAAPTLAGGVSTLSRHTPSEPICPTCLGKLDSPYQNICPHCGTPRDPDSIRVLQARQRQENGPRRNKWSRPNPLGWHQLGWACVGLIAIILPGIVLGALHLTHPLEIYFFFISCSFIPILIVPFGTYALMRAIVPSGWPRQYQPALVGAGLGALIFSLFFFTSMIIAGRRLDGGILLWLVPIVGGFFGSLGGISSGQANPKDQ